MLEVPATILVNGLGGIKKVEVVHLDACQCNDGMSDGTGRPERPNHAAGGHGERILVRRDPFRYKVLGYVAKFRPDLPRIVLREDTGVVKYEVTKPRINLRGWDRFTRHLNDRVRLVPDDRPNIVPPAEVERVRPRHVFE
jgi:hypothetical protein